MNAQEEFTQELEKKLKGTTHKGKTTELTFDEETTLKEMINIVNLHLIRYKITTGIKRITFKDNHNVVVEI